MGEGESRNSRKRRQRSNALFAALFITLFLTGLVSGMLIVHITSTKQREDVVAEYENAEQYGQK